MDTLCTLRDLDALSWGKARRQVTITRAINGGKPNQPLGSDKLNIVNILNLINSKPSATENNNDRLLFLVKALPEYIGAYNGSKETSFSQVCVVVVASVLVQSRASPFARLSKSLKLPQLEHPLPLYFALSPNYPKPSLLSRSLHFLGSPVDK